MKIVCKECWKMMKHYCKHWHTPYEVELYGSRAHNRCFFNTQKWDESVVCSYKNCPIKEQEEQL